VLGGTVGESVVGFSLGKLLGALVGFDDTG